jgi:ATP-dependent Zn protease
MSDGLLTAIVNWLPILAIVVAWLFFMRRIQNPKNGISQSTYMELSLKSQEEQNRALLAVIDRMDRRITLLEKSGPNTAARS